MTGNGSLILTTHFPKASNIKNCIRLNGIGGGVEGIPEEISRAHGVLDMKTKLTEQSPSVLSIIGPLLG